MKDSAQVFRRELKDLRDQTHAAIDESQLGDLEDAFELYGELVRALLARFAELEEAFAVTPGDVWFNPYGRELEWLEADVFDFAKSILTRHGDQAGLRVAMSFLMNVLNDLWGAGETGAHRRFVDLMLQIYRFAVSSTGTNPKSAGRILSNLRSHAQYVIEPSKTNQAQRASALTQVVETLFEAFRTSVTIDGTAHANVCLKELDEVKQWLGYRDRGFGSRNRVDGGAVDQVVRRFDAFSLGALGYLDLLVQRGMLDSADAASMSQRLTRTLDEDNLWPAYVEISHPLQDAYPWWSWESEIRPPEQNGGPLGDLSAAIDRVMIGRLRSIGGSWDPAQQLGDLGPSSASHAAQRLLTALDQMTPASNESETRRSERLREELLSAKTTFEDAEELERDQLPLISEKVQRFENGIEVGWNEPQFIRDSADQIVDDGDPPEGFLGIHTVGSKDWFSESNVSADPASYGKELGRGLARGEVSRIVKEAAEGVATSTRLSRLGPLVTAAVARQRAAGFDPSIVFFDSWRIGYALTGTYDHQPSSDARHEGAQVVGDYIGGDPICIVADVRRAFCIRRWMASAEDGESLLAGGLIAASVRNVTEDVARELVRENTNFRRNPDGTFATTAESIKRLRNSAIVKVVVRSQVELVDSHAAELFWVREDPT